jgi:hypothetical protein
MNLNEVSVLYVIDDEHQHDGHQLNQKVGASAGGGLSEGRSYEHAILFLARR